MADAKATSSADAAIGTTPVKAAEPAAVVAAISPVTTDSVNEDRFTASGETSNIDMFVSRGLIRRTPLRDYQIFLRTRELCNTGERELCNTNETAIHPLRVSPPTLPRY